MYFPELIQATAGDGKEDTPPSELPNHHGLVLVVDDEPMVRDMAAAQLKRLGFAVVTANDGLDAVERFRIHKIDIRLAILDLSMPRLDGWQTLTALRALRADLPVILASGYDESQVNRDDRSERPQAFLQEPYGAKELMAALDSVLNSGGSPKNQSKPSEN